MSALLSPSEREVQKLLLTIDEAAATLSVGRSTVKELIRIGRLRSISIFGCRRVPIDALRELAARGTNENGAAGTAPNSEI